LARVLVLRARPVAVDARVYVKVVAFDNLVGLRMKTWRLFEYVAD